jgi:hypothetical protein
MDSGVSLNPSFTATSSMTFTHFMGRNPSAFHNGMQNYETQSMPWVSNHFSLGIPNMPSPFPSSPFPSYMNPSFGSDGMMACCSRLHLIRVMSLNQLSLWEVGISPLTDPILATLFQEPVLKWVIIILITPHLCILCPLCQFLQTLFPWWVPMFPLVFHTEGIIFMVWDTLFTEPLRMGATYILT